MNTRQKLQRKPLLGASCAGIFVFGLLGLGGCSEGPQQMGQATTYKQGKYQGKPDSKPYEAGPSTFSQEKSWQPGDKVAWEKAIKTRQQAQNEYNRAE